MASCRCECCANPAPGETEWGWCLDCNEAGCRLLDGGDVVRGKECPVLVARAKRYAEAKAKEKERG